MSLRVRLTLVATAVVAVVVAAASVTTYFVMRHELIGQVDSGLAAHAVDELQHPQPEFHGFGEFSSDYVAIVGPTGAQANPFNIPITPDIRTAAAGKTNSYYYRNTVVRDKQVREIVAPIEGGGAIVIVRIIDNVNHDLNRLRLILLLVSLGGIGAAALLGFFVSRTTLAPVRRLTSAAERISETGDPSERVPETGRGELARLGASFNTMLGALEEAIETQRRFVADASHELRTPLTSLQTNIEVLKQQERLAPDARDRLFDDLQREAHEMRNLITGLLELARGDDTRLAHGPVQLDELVENAVERARSRYPQIRFETDIEPATIDGAPERLERAVWNLLENAGKWSAPGSAVEVNLHGGELTVRDHGPGIAAEDREHVFDRFYRSAAARALPGSGLGLAIVREVAEAHGGRVGAEEAPGGGALLRLRLNS